MVTLGGREVETWQLDLKDSFLYPWLKHSSLRLIPELHHPLSLSNFLGLNVIDPGPCSGAVPVHSGYLFLLISPFIFLVPVCSGGSDPLEVSASIIPETSLVLEWCGSCCWCLMILNLHRILSSLNLLCQHSTRFPPNVVGQTSSRAISGEVRGFVLKQPAASLFSWIWNQLSIPFIDLTWWDSG